MILLLLFLLGTLVGSFLNVCIWRMPRHESVVYPPSHCPSCNTRLTTLDLFPLVSQLYLRGRCRYCGAKFSWRYFGIEVLTGFLFLLVGLQAGNLSEGGFLASWTGDYVKLVRDLIFMSTLVVIFWVDFDTRYMQLESVFLLGVGGVGYQVWLAIQGWMTYGRDYHGQDITTDGKIIAFLLPAPVPECLLAAVVTATLLFLVREFFSRLYGREAMGFGDVIMVAAIATYLGWHMTLLTFFFLAAILGATVGVALQVPQAVRAKRWGKKRLERYGPDIMGGPDLPRLLARRAFRKAMPFGPMLAIGAVAALLYGHQINTWYLGLFPQDDLTRPLPVSLMVQK
jgi:leader peptidase (prepilin peptidase) / N-methyltransferase